MGRIRSFYFGLTLPFSAIRLIFSKPPLLVLSLIPIVVTFLLYTYVIVHMQEGARDLLNGCFTRWGWDTHSWAAAIIMIVSQLLLILIGILTFTFTAGIVSAPFNDFLAEKTEKFAKPTLPSPRKSSMRGRLKILSIDVVKTTAATGGSVLAILFAWVPGCSVLAFLVAFLLVTFQFISYPQTRRGLGIEDGLKFLWTFLYASLGFGVITSVLFAIPFVSIICIPIAVVGGTMLVARAEPSSLPRLR